MRTGNTRKTLQKTVRFFTMIEMMTVIGIIAILFAISIGVSGLVRNRIAGSKTRGLLKQMELALENYKMNYGFYIQTRNAAGAFYIDAFCDSSGKLMPKVGIDMEKLKSSCEYYSGADVGYQYALKDGWGKPIVYRSPGPNNTSTFDIGSVGGDKQYGDASGEGPPPNIVTDSEYKDNFGKGDDITNFNGQL